MFTVHASRQYVNISNGVRWPWIMMNQRYSFVIESNSSIKILTNPLEYIFLLNCWLSFSIIRFYSQKTTVKAITLNNWDRSIHWMHITLDNLCHSHFHTLNMVFHFYKWDIAKCLPQNSCMRYTKDGNCFLDILLHRIRIRHCSHWQFVWNDRFFP